MPSRLHASDTTIGLALIAKNEEASLPRLLGSITGAFDHVVLCDTGSTDGTVAVFLAWATRTRQKHTITRFKWCNDFSAARNHAHSKLPTTWHVTADCDETIENAHLLRGLLAERPDADAMIVRVDHGSPLEPCIIFPARCWQRGRFVGRVHERIATEGVVGTLAFSDVRWVHHRVGEQPWERDKAIMHQWIAEDPDDPWLHEVILHQYIGEDPDNPMLHEMLDESAL